MFTLLAKDKAREQRRALLGRKIVKGAVEHELREQKLVARADLARDTPLLLDNVVRGRKAEATQHTLAALELVELQHIVRRGNLRLDGCHLVLRGLLGGVERIQLVTTRAVLRDRRIRNALAQDLLLAEQLLELDVVDLHVLHRVEQWEALREAAVHLGHVLPDLRARLLEAQILRQEQADPAELLHMRQQHRHDDPLAALAARFDAQERRRELLLLRDDRAGCAPQQHMHNILGVRRRAHLSIGAARHSALLVRDDDAPAKVALGRRHLHEATCLQEREGIAGVPLHLAAVLVELL